MTATLLSEKIMQLSSWTIANRRHLHQYPEPSYHEKMTQEFILSRLIDFDLFNIEVDQTNIIAYLKNPKDLPSSYLTIALRADIDALPINEETSLPFKSLNNGVMHACGHDGHTAILITTAAVLSQLKEEVHVQVKFIFQAAEEVIPGGSTYLIEKGVLDDVNEIYGLHLWEPLQSGLISIREGEVMAGADEFSIYIHGKGGHGSMPNLCVDPIYIAASIITQCQTIVSRLNTPLKPLVLSFGQIKAGSAYNVIPDKAYLNGTIRYYEPSSQVKIRRQLESIISHQCEMFGATYTLDYIAGNPPVINDAQSVKRMRDVATKLYGENKVKLSIPVMAGEDFAHYLQHRKGAFFFLGIGDRDKKTFPHHHPQFDIDEEMLDIGVHLFSLLILSYRSLHGSI